MPDGPLLRALQALTGADTTPDAELLRRFVAVRDDTAFELLVRRHADLVWKVCRGILRDDPHAAEDAFQAAFLALTKSAHSVGGESVAGWLFRVARNASLRARLKASRTPEPLPDSLPTTHPAPDDVAASAELATLLTEEVGRLAAKFRAPVLLCYFEGHTHAEAAERLGWAVGTVASRIARAKDRLRDQLARRGVALSVAGLTAALSQPASAVPPGLVRSCVQVSISGSASPAVVSLTEGVLSAMRIAKLKGTAAAVALLVGLAGGGTLLAVNQSADGPPAAVARPKVIEGPDGWKLTVHAIAGPKERAHSRRNLEALSSALFAYQLDHGHLPTDILDPNTKKPLLSWRVAILPYIEQRALHKQFKLDEPWDSEHNKKATAAWIKLYAATVRPDGQEPYGLTRVKRFTGPDTLHIPGGQVDVTKTPDGREWTILLVEVGDPVPWAKPDDPVATQVAGDQPHVLKDPTLWKGPYSNAINVAMANGVGASLKPNLDANVIAGLIYWNDGRVLPKWEEIVAVPTREQDVADLEALAREVRKLTDELARLTEEEANLRVELAKQGKEPADLSTPFAARLLRVFEAMQEAQHEVVRLRQQLEKAKK